MQLFLLFWDKLFYLFTDSAEKMDARNDRISQYSYYELSSFDTLTSEKNENFKSLHF